MKYDRPVWQIMHLCADAMPEVFRYEDVRNWFSANYPDVNEATIRAHLIGLTEGGRAKHVQFAARSPIFRRVARGEYSPIPVAERGEDPDAPLPSASRLKMSGNGHSRVEPGDAHEPDGQIDDSPTAEPDRPVPLAVDDDGEVHPPDVILLGSVGDRVNVPAPAKEIFREMSFQLSRLDAELSGSEWFILSAEHGLVAPNEWISPDSRTLADMEPEYRVVWAQWIVTRLQSLVGSLDGLHVQVDAPNAFTGPLFAALQETGAVVTSGRSRVSFPAPAVTPAEVEAPVPVAGPVRAVEPLVEAPADERNPGAMSPATLFLADPFNAMPATELAALPDSPGLYAWFVDAPGARVLNRCLKLPIREGVVFVGQVGGSSWHSLADPVLNVRDHVERIQLRGRARASTFRMTLATVLGEHLGMTSLEDPKLSAWMLEHLSVSAWGTDNVGDLPELEQLVVSELDPPLNVDHLPATEYRARLNQMRRFLG